jgi:hypothetical protein
MDMMNTGYRLVSAWAAGLAMVVAGVPGPAGSVSAQAVNPCTLLTVDEIQPLAPNASIADGVPSSLQTLGTSSCRYTWGAGVGRFRLDVTVNEAPRMYPGMSPDQIRQRLQESLKEGTTDAVIPDVGEAAVFKAESPLLATATASTKGRILGVQLDGLDAREKKDDVVALLKTAVSRL